MMKEEFNKTEEEQAKSETKKKELKEKMVTGVEEKGPAAACADCMQFKAIFDSTNYISFV